MPDPPTTAVFKVPLIEYIDSQIASTYGLGFGPEEIEYQRGREAAYEDIKEWVEGA